MTAKNKPLHGLITVPPPTPVRDLPAGVSPTVHQDEATKAFISSVLFGDKTPYTEDRLSNKGYRDLQATAYAALAQNQGIDYTHYPQRDVTDLHNLIGATSPAGVRRVAIAGHPYVQVRDIYDFKDDVELLSDMDIPYLLTTAKYALRGYRPAARKLGVNLAGRLGVERNVNMLFPEDPGQPALPTQVEQFRQQTNYLPAPPFAGHSFARGR